MTDGAQIAYYIWNRDLKLSHVAKVLGISTSTLKNKLSGRTDFKVSEADTLSSLLGLTPAQRDLCFFCGGGGGAPASGLAARPMWAGGGPLSGRWITISRPTPPAPT